MADRASVSIMIGGTLARDLLSQFANVVAADGAALDWEGTPFTLNDLPGGAALTLYANEVAWGRFDQIEDFCLTNGLAFVRWAGGCAGSFGAERVIFRGGGESCCFAVTDDDDVVIGHQTVRELGSVAAIEQYFADASWQPPALTFVDHEYCK